MGNFKRARNDEQKKEKMVAIKQTANQLFLQFPYAEITLSTIAQYLHSSRTNLYKYVTTKEEIFLELFFDYQCKFTNDLESKFYDKVHLSIQDIAEQFCEILEKNLIYLKYQSILITIIESNVSMDCMIAFKKKAHANLLSIFSYFSKYFNMTKEEVETIYWTILYHAIGLTHICFKSEFVKEAMKAANIELKEKKFKEEMQKFIIIYLKGRKEK